MRNQFWQGTVSGWTWYLSAWWTPLIPVIGIGILMVDVIILLTFLPDVTGPTAPKILVVFLFCEMTCLLGLAFLMVCAIFGMFIAGLVHLCHPRIGRGLVVWLEAASGVLLTGITLFNLLIMLMFTSLFGPSEDHFEDHLTLPEGVKLTEPLSAYDGVRVESLGAEPSVAIASQTGTQMVLWNDFQPGLYQMEIRCNPGESGQIYLKAYEITHDTPLSTHPLKERSTKHIGGSNDVDELFYARSHFTIYEGDWGQPYAARFELWFIPDANPSQERKLFERNFKIEGWMQ